MYTHLIIAYNDLLYKWFSSASSIDTLSRECVDRYQDSILEVIEGKELNPPSESLLSNPKKIDGLLNYPVSSELDFDDMVKFTFLFNFLSRRKSNFFRNRAKSCKLIGLDSYSVTFSEKKINVESAKENLVLHVNKYLTNEEYSFIREVAERGQSNVANDIECSRQYIHSKYWRVLNKLINAINNNKDGTT